MMWTAWLCAVAAAVGTGAWAVLLSESSNARDDVRYAMVGAGILSLLSFLVASPCIQPSVHAVGMTLVLAGYQGLIYAAVNRGGAVMQAVINCNVIVVCLHRHFYVEAADQFLALALAVLAATSSAALLSAIKF